MRLSLSALFALSMLSICSASERVVVDISETSPIVQLWHKPADPSDPAPREIVAEEEIDITRPDGKRGFASDSGGGRFIRFLARGPEIPDGWDLASAVRFSAWVHSTVPVELTVRYSAAGSQTTDKVYHNGGGWEKIEWLVKESPENETATVLTGATLVDLIILPESEDPFKLVVADFVATE